MRNRKGIRDNTVRTTRPRTLEEPSRLFTYNTLRLIAILILFTLICFFVVEGYSTDYSSHPSGRWVEGKQVYSGSADRTQLRLEFKKANLWPYNVSDKIIGFLPFCGSPGSAEANASRGLLREGTVSWTDNKKIEVKVMTSWERWPGNGIELMNATRCALDNIYNIMQNNLSMKLMSEKIDWEETEPWDTNVIPGYDIGLVLIVVICLSAIFSTKYANRSR